MLRSISFAFFLLVLLGNPVEKLFYSQIRLYLNGIKNDFIVSDTITICLLILFVRKSSKHNLYFGLPSGFLGSIMYRPIYLYLNGVRSHVTILETIILILEAVIICLLIFFFETRKI